MEPVSILLLSYSDVECSITKEVYQLYLTNVSFTISLTLNLPDKLALHSVTGPSLPVLSAVVGFVYAKYAVSDEQKLNRWFQDVSKKGLIKDPKMDPRWNQDGPKMGQKWTHQWSKRDPRWNQDGSKMGPKGTHPWSMVDPRWNRDDSKRGPK